MAVKFVSMASVPVRQRQEVPIASIYALLYGS